MFIVDVASRVPIYEQIINEIERFVLLGILKPNEQLPSVRELAVTLGINPNTIQKAYGELEQRKIIVSEAGKGNFITKDITGLIKKRKNEIIENIKEEIEILITLGINKEEILKHIENYVNI